MFQLPFVACVCNSFFVLFCRRDAANVVIYEAKTITINEAQSAPSILES